jgi:hypothetical protein
MGFLPSKSKVPSFIHIADHILRHIISSPRYLKTKLSHTMTLVFSLDISQTFRLLTRLNSQLNEICKVKDNMINNLSPPLRDLELRTPTSIHEDHMSKYF